MIIAIDGPVASGKSTIARKLAHELGFYYLYTGFLYRGLGYVLAHHYGYDTAKMAKPRHEDIDDIVHHSHFEYRYEDGVPKIIFEGEDISAQLKSKDVDNWSSLISAYSYVREAVFEYQLRIGREQDVVAEGRDMGTVVFPQAEHKFFLTASVDVRAQRWQKMQEKAGAHYSFEESRAAVIERDRRDAGREHSPLKRASDAFLIDCSDMTVDQVVQEIRRLIKK